MSSQPVVPPKISVVLVDDSATVRGFLRRIIEKDSALEIVTTAVNGQEGLDRYKRYKPDIVLMDIEMPEMDGLTALREIIAHDPDARVIMCSSLTQKGAESTFKALEIGAVDCLAKPSSNRIDTGQSFEDEVLSKIKALSRKRQPDETVVTPPATQDSAASSQTPKQANSQQNIILRPMPTSLSNRFPLAIAIGSSTGGPNALIDLLSNVNKGLMLPIFITQHIPPSFSAYLAQNITKKTGFVAQEAQNDMPIEPGKIYIAPGGMHMGIKPGTPKTLKLIDSEPVNFCKPSINVMLSQIQEAYGNNVLTVMLTGMGSDGATECRRMVESGNNNILIAQDEQTSVVWGIPGAVAKAGMCHAVLPLNEIAPAINKLVKRQPIT